MHIYMGIGDRHTSIHIVKGLLPKHKHEINNQAQTQNTAETPQTQSKHKHASDEQTQNTKRTQTQQSTNSANAKHTRNTNTKQTQIERNTITPNIKTKHRKHAHNNF